MHAAELGSLTATATEATKGYSESRRAYAIAIARRMELEAQRPIEKDAAVRRAMTQIDPDTGKAPSYSAAERTVESDPTYATLLEALRLATVDEARAIGLANAHAQQHALAVALIPVMAVAE